MRGQVCALPATLRRDLRTPLSRFVAGAFCSSSAGNCAARTSTPQVVPRSISHRPSCFPRPLSRARKRRQPAPLSTRRVTRGLCHTTRAMTRAHPWRRNTMADPNALPRRIVKETQRPLSEPGELRGTARGVCVRACAALASPRVCRAPEHWLCVSQRRASMPHRIRTTSDTSTWSCRGHSRPHTRVRTRSSPLVAQRHSRCVCASRRRRGHL